MGYMDHDDMEYLNDAIEKYLESVQNTQKR